MNKLDFLKNWFTHISKYKYYFILIGLYLLFFIWINPLAQPNYLVGDEWSSFRQVEAFQQGIFRLNGAKDTSFILQGVLAFLLTFLINDIFLVVRVLNLLVFILLILGVIKLTSLLLGDSKKSLIVSLLIVFNPLVYFLGFTFYSEIYLLTLLVWSFYFFGKFYQSKNSKLKLLYLVVSATLSGASVLVRQQGVIIPAVFFLLYLVQNSNFDFKKIWKLLYSKNLIIFSLIVSFFILIYGLWPVYIEWDREHLFSGFVKLMNKKTSEFRPHDYFPYLYSVFYLAFFTFPLIKKPRLNIFGLIASVYLSWVAYNIGNFPIGDILSLKGFVIKESLEVPTSIFFNPISRAMVSLIQGFGVVYLLVEVKKTFDSRKEQSQIERLILSSALLYLISNFFIADVYDRYLIVPFILIILVFAKSSFEFDMKIIGKLTFIFLILLSTFMTYEFVQTRQAMHSLAVQNPEKVSKLSKILVTEEYGKYYKSRESKDFTGLIYARPENKYQCEIQKMYKNNYLESSTSNFSNFLNIPKSQSKDTHQLITSIKILEPSNLLLGYEAHINLFCQR